MARLISTAVTSFDGYVEDARGSLEWSAPDVAVLRFITELERPIGTYLYGRRLYESMMYWETNPPDDGTSSADHDYAAMWRGADKVVFSRTLAEPSTTRTRLEREFDPAAIRRLVDESDTDVSVGGAELAGQAIAAGIVDEIRHVVIPVSLGGGKRALPLGPQVPLDLVDLHRFANGVVYLAYRVLPGTPAPS